MHNQLTIMSTEIEFVRPCKNIHMFISDVMVQSYSYGIDDYMGLAIADTSLSVLLHASRRLIFPKFLCY